MRVMAGKIFRNKRLSTVHGNAIVPSEQRFQVAEVRFYSIVCIWDALSPALFKSP